MHPDLEEILAVRDGEAGPEAARHVASCPECSAELTRLREVRDALRALPPAAPPPELWAATRARIGTARRPSSYPWLAAAAACLMLGAGTAALLWNRAGVGGGTGPGSPGQMAGVSSPGSAAGEPSETVTPGGDPEVARLIRNSQRLESMLDRMDERPTVVSGREALAEMGLQDRLAQLDAQLGASEPGPAAHREQVDLWKERVELLGTLAQVKGARKKTVEI